MDDPNDEIWVKISGGENEFGLIKHRVKKMYRYVSQQCLFVLTSLILCIEQIILNPFNPVKVEYMQNKQEEEKAGRHSSMHTLENLPSKREDLIDT